MKYLFHLSGILILIAIVLLATTVVTGDSEIGIFVIFPFIIANGPLAVLAALMLFAGIVIFMAGFFTSISIRANDAIERNYPTVDGKSERKFGGVVLIGPIPITFGSDRKIARDMIALGIALVILIIVMFSLFAIFIS